MRLFSLPRGIFTLSIALTVLVGCNSDADPDAARKTISIDGSSTVFPISQAVAEEFENRHSDVRVFVGRSGTGGGFKKFLRGEIDINDASRPISEGEITGCKENGIEFIELRVAIDGLSVVVHAQNDWADCMSIDQLRALWEPQSAVKTWSQLNPDWPNEEIKLFGPDADSGTFDYFTEVIVGEAGASRTDYEPNSDDNVLVTGVGGEPYALGYFGYAYYAENKDKLKVLGISEAAEPSDSDCVKPTPETIEGGQYVPLSRPLFLYVSRNALARPEVASFLRFYLEEGQDLVGEIGYVRLSSSALAEVRSTLDGAVKQVAAGAEPVDSE